MDRATKLSLRLFILAGIVAGLIFGVQFAAKQTRLLPAFWRIPAAPPRAAADRDARWQQDLDYLARELPRLHVAPFHSVSPADFEQAIADVKTRVPALSDAELALEVMRIVALLGDAHTRAVPGPLVELRLYPLQLTWFADGLYVTQAMMPTRAALHTRLVQIGGQDVAAVIAQVTPWISHENEPGLQDRLGNFLLNPELLHRLGVLPDMEQGRYTFEAADGTRFDLVMQPILDSEYSAYFGALVTATPAADAPLWRQHPDQNYWFEYLEASQTVYFRYSACAEMEGRSFKAFNDELFDFIAAHPVQRLVVDLRDNGGGSSSILWPFERRLKEHPLNRAGSLYVLIDRGVFSSAVLNAVELREQTQATLVGSPTAGRPNHYGEVKTFALPNSQVRIQYSTKYFHYTDDDAPSVLPAVTIEPTLADVLAGRDPVLEYVLAQP